MKKIFIMVSTILVLLLGESFAGEKIEYYQNSIFGFSFKYPSNILTEQSYNSNGNLIWLENKSETITIELLNTYNEDIASVMQMYKKRLKEENENKYTEIVSKIIQKNWFQIAGNNHENNTTFIDKEYFFSSRRDLSNVRLGFHIEFPTKDTRKYEQLLRNFLNSYKLSNKESSNINVPTQDTKKKTVTSYSDGKLLMKGITSGMTFKHGCEVR